MTGLIEIKSSPPAKLENLEKTFKMQGPQTEKNSCFDLQLHLKQQNPIWLYIIHFSVYHLDHVKRGSSG